MSEQKNKIKSNKLPDDLDNREKVKSVVQRFVTSRIPEVTDATDETNIAAANQTLLKYYLKNMMEDAVIDEVAASLRHRQDVCKCERCFYDICALALNSLPNHFYATTKQGELIQRATTLLNVRIRNKITAEVFIAIEKVSRNPVHEAEEYNI